eukprot:SAG31_NODE_12_length_38498_cov_21.161671_19_plen_80_part_00
MFERYYNPRSTAKEFTMRSYCYKFSAETADGGRSIDLSVPITFGLPTYASEHIPTGMQDVIGTDILYILVVHIGRTYWP